VKIPEGAWHLDWRLGDPGGADIGEVRQIRDEIQAGVQRLCDETRSSATDQPQRRGEVVSMLPHGVGDPRTHTSRRNAHVEHKHEANT